MEVLILGVILQYMVSASFSCLLWSVKVNFYLPHSAHLVEVWWQLGVHQFKEEVSEWLDL